jgi:WD40 repeat protein
VRLVTSTARPTRIRVWDAHTGRPLCDWIRSDESVSDVRFSADSRWILASAGWKLPLYVAEKSTPSWVAELAEAVAGIRLNKDGISEPVPFSDYLRMREWLHRTSATSDLALWVSEFVKDAPKPSEF